MSSLVERLKQGKARLRGWLKRLSQKSTSGLTGRCDGVDRGEASGWAFRTDAPTQRVEIEQWVNGVLAGVTTADIFRSDLLEGGVGDGAHGWRAKVALDPAKVGTQHVEFRFRGGEVLTGGAFDMAFTGSRSRSDETSGDRADQRRGRAGSPGGSWATCDGLDGDIARGWGWRPEFPEEHVEIEQWIDGVLAGVALADIPRPDLQAAGKGHGRYGWKMKLALDPVKSRAQQVELRVRGGAMAGTSRFSLTRDAISPDSSVMTSDEAAADGVVGWYDGLKGSTLHGWAWNPARPDDTAEVELWVDGVRTHEAVANGFRPDLRAQGISHGRYGWRLPVQLDPDRKEPLKIEIRTKGGEPLGGGVFELRNDLSLDDPVNADLRPFVLSVLQSERKVAPSGRLPMPKTALLLYCPEAREKGEFWAREYDDYRGAMKSFAPVLKSLGDVYEVTSSDEANQLCEERRAKGEDCILFSFASPRFAPLDARCHIVPVFAWSFSSIPTGMSDGDHRSDWRYVLRATGQAIVFSQVAAQAVKAAMGANFPVVVIPPPVADRISAMPIPSVGAMREITLNGVILDSREHTFDPSDTEYPPAIWKGPGIDGSVSRRINVEGVVVVAICELMDGRANWKDILGGFAAANRSNKDATLLMRLEEPYAEWWQEVLHWLRLLPQFDCRIIVMRGYMDDGEYRALIAASHWYANVSKAAGLCTHQQAFMSAGRPSISTTHTAMADFVSSSNSLTVASGEEPWLWPDAAENEGWCWAQHPADVGPVTRYRISWSSVVTAFAEAYRLTSVDKAGYDALSAGARQSMQSYCGDRLVTGKLEELLGPGSLAAHFASGPSALLAEPPA
ncbi:MAG: hypothetical protein Q8R82_19745 [Hyphomonadaceae bacterium]|nr:hypothetical protein [Hyphomonadaceae bacterium]